MKSSLKRGLTVAAATLLAGNAQAASLYLSPSTIQPTLIGTVPAFLDVMLDLQGVTSIGGGIDLNFEGVVSYVAFLPSEFFNGKNTDDTGDTDFTGYRVNPPTGSDLEIYIGDFNGFTGLNSLGTLQVLVAAGSPGSITVTPSPANRWGGFADANGQPLQGFTYSGATVVPLPATAWLFATGFGLAGFWRRRRA